MSNADENGAEARCMKKRKLCREVRKLDLEIERLQRPVWKEAAFAVAALAAITSIAVGLLSGWFDRERAELAQEKAKLARSIATLSGEKRELAKQTEELESENSDLQNRNNELGAMIPLLSARRLALEDQVARLEKIRTAREASISTALLRVKELIRRGDLLQPGMVVSHLEEVMLHLSEEDLQEEIDFIEALESSDDQSESESVVRDYLDERGLLDDDGCFEDHDGQTHCTNF